MKRMSLGRDRIAAAQSNGRSAWDERVAYDGCRLHIASRSATFTLAVEESMRKLALDPESLSVQSFATHAAADALRGTVQAMSTVDAKCPTGISHCVTYCACPNTQ